MAKKTITNGMSMQTVRTNINDNFTELYDAVGAIPTVNDTLTSSSTTEALSAKQGKILKDELNSHTADNVTQKEVHGLKIESGTFTPTVVATVEPATYGAQKGYYEKIGKQVTVYIALAVATKAAGMSGEVRIGGLPFAPASDVERYSACSVGEFANLSYGTGKQLMALIYPGSNTIRLLITSDTAVSVVTADGISDGFYIILQCTYKTN